MIEIIFRMLLDMNTQQEVDEIESLVKEFYERVNYFIENDVTTEKNKVSKVKRIVRCIDNNGKKTIYQLSIPLPEELLSDFSVPEDCKHVVLSHMMFSISLAYFNKSTNDNEKENLIKIFAVYGIYRSDFENNNQLLQKESLSNDLFDDFKKLTIKKNNKTKANLRKLALFIEMIRTSYAIND